MKIGGGATRKQDWGDRAQIGGTLKELRDLQGNRDGIWDNETKPAGTTGDLFDRDPLAVKAKAGLSVGFSTKDEVSELAGFLATQEAKWGQPVIDPEVKAKLNGGDLFAAQKAIALERMGWDPAGVKDGFVQASGSVDGVAVADRELFFQQFEPLGDPKGEVRVVSPGFQETGRGFYEQIDALRKDGYLVFAMDHQWAGQSEGKSGGIDSGHGVARDVAAMTAFAAQEGRARYGDDVKVALFANSMGAGVGAVGAATYNDQGKVKLNGPAMPDSVDLILQDPFLGATPSLTNKTLQLAAKLPLMNAIKAPTMQLPDLSDTPLVETKIAQGATLENVGARLQAFDAVNGFLDDLWAMLRAGEGPTGKVEIIHAERDTLADYARSEELATLLGDRAHLTTIDSKDHVFEVHPEHQGLAIEASRRISSDADRATEADEGEIVIEED